MKNLTRLCCQMSSKSTKLINVFNANPMIMWTCNPQARKINLGKLRIRFDRSVTHSYLNQSTKNIRMNPYLTNTNSLMKSILKTP
jgi:hypothetical protein